MCFGGSPKPPTPTKVPTPPSPTGSGQGGTATGATMEQFNVPDYLIPNVKHPADPQRNADGHMIVPNGNWHSHPEEMGMGVSPTDENPRYVKKWGGITGIPMFLDSGSAGSMPSDQLSPLTGTQRTGSTAVVNTASLTAPLKMPVAPLPLFR